MSESLDALKHAFFVKELGISEEDVPEAERNLLGVFGVLLDIDNQKK